LAFGICNKGIIAILTMKLAYKLGIEKPYKELVQNTENIHSATKELEQVSKIGCLNQKIFIIFLDQNIQLEKQLKYQFNKIGSFGAYAFGIINKI
jgi:hypothetical protein